MSDSPRTSLKRTLLVVLAASLMPFGTAFAQEYPLVRVAGEDTPVTMTRGADSRVVTTAAVGTVLEAIHVQGDQYRHLDTNWYLVVLPVDPRGRRHLGWISGRQVEEVPQTAPEAETATPSSARTALPAADASPPQPVNPATMAAAEDRLPVRPAAPPAADEPEVSEVVLQFDFDKSDLTATAASSLDCAIELMEADGQAVSFALEGHADSTGPDVYNERLGLARAETVKQYLAEQHQIPAGRISVVSHGESKPLASNDTREGRAQNRRVVVLVGG